STPSSCCGTPCTATSPGSSQTAASTHRGTCRRPIHRSLTCSPRYDGPSSPLVLWAPAQLNPPTQKSARSSEHGHSLPHRPRKSSAIMERWIRTCRRELLDRMLIWNQRHLLHALHEYEAFYNAHRRH